MEEEQFYNNIQKAFDDLPENYSILEERIEIEVQMKYFELSKNIRKKNISDECFANREELFSDVIHVFYSSLSSSTLLDIFPSLFALSKLL